MNKPKTLKERLDFLEKNDYIYREEKKIVDEEIKKIKLENKNGGDKKILAMKKNKCFNKS